MLFTLLISVMLSAAVPAAQSTMESAAVPAAQSATPTYWDKVLDCYERLCDACITNKDSQTIAAIKADLDALLKKPSGKMNAQQQKRFQDIRERYNGARFGNPESSRTDTIVIIKQVPQEKLREIEHIAVYDTVHVKNSIGTIVVEHRYSQKDTTIIIHTLQSPKRPLSMFAGVSAGIAPDFSLGLFAGAGDKAGGYIKARSNFRPVTASGNVDEPGQAGFWGNGNSAVSRSLACAGGWLTLFGGLRLYAGAGYGECSFYVQDISNAWLNVSSASYRGLCVDYGLMYSFGNFMLTCGANTTKFKYTDLEAGIAIMF